MNVDQDDLVSDTAGRYGVAWCSPKKCLSVTCDKLSGSKADEWILAEADQTLAGSPTSREIGDEHGAWVENTRGAGIIKPLIEVSHRDELG